MRRVGRPGGLVAGFVWDFAGERTPTSPARIGLNRIGVQPPPAPGTPESRLEALESLFAAAGFREIATLPIDVTLTFADFDDYWETQTPKFSASGKAIAALSQTDRQRLIEQLRARLPPGPDGSVSYSARANAIKARVPERK